MAEHEYHPLYTDRMTFEDQEEEEMDDAQEGDLNAVSWPFEQLAKAFDTPARRLLASERVTRLLKEWRKEDGDTNHPDE